MSYNQPKLETLPLEALTLDTINPRFVDEQDGEEATIKHLFDTAKVLELATDILKLGYFENEVPIVLAEKHKYTVLEGNRRVCCLKALKKPSLTPTEYSNDINQLLIRYEPEAQNLPGSIRVLLVHTREEAAPHIARLHTKTTKEKWTTDQQATFYYNQYLHGTKISTLLAADEKRGKRLIRMAVMRRLITSIPYENDELRRYAASSDLKMSTLEYAYGKAEIQEAFGIEFTELGLVRQRGSTELHPKPEEVAASLSTNHIVAIEYIIGEFKAKKLNTRSPRLKSRDQQYLALIETLKHLQPNTPNKTHAHDTNKGSDKASNNDIHSDPVDTQPHTPDAEDKAGDTTDNTRRRPSRPPRPSSLNQLPFEGVNYDKLAVNLRDRYWELSRLNISLQPIAAACLMRSVLECQIKASSRSYLTQQLEEAKDRFRQVEDSHTADIETYRSGYETKNGKQPTDDDLNRYLKSIDSNYSKLMSRIKKLESLSRSGQLDEYFKVCCLDRFGSNRTLRSSLNRIANSNTQTPGTIAWFNMALHNHEFTTSKDEIHEAWRLVSPIIRHLVDTTARKED